MREPKHQLPSNVEWRYWGRRDPFWGTATWARKKISEPNAWTPGEFYHKGALEWNVYKRHWLQYGMGGQSVVEIGSGPGRMTNQLSESFSHVFALDVSEGMIAKARQHLKQDNILFILTSGSEIPIGDQSVDAIFTCQVFQHLPGFEPIAQYVRESLRVLRPGGTVMLHVPMLGSGPNSSAVMRAVRELRGMEVVKRAKGWVMRSLIHAGLRVNWMAGQVIAPERMIALMEAVGFARIEIRIIEVVPGGYHSFVFGTCPNIPTQPTRAAGSVARAADGERTGK